MWILKTKHWCIKSVIDGHWPTFYPQWDSLPSSLLSCSCVPWCTRSPTRRAVRCLWAEAGYSLNWSLCWMVMQAEAVEDRHGPGVWSLWGGWGRGRPPSLSSWWNTAVLVILDLNVRSLTGHTLLLLYLFTFYLHYLNTFYNLTSYFCFIWPFGHFSYLEDLILLHNLWWWKILSFETLNNLAPQIPAPAPAGLRPARHWQTTPRSTL